MSIETAILLLAGKSCDNCMQITTFGDKTLCIISSKTTLNGHVTKSKVLPKEGTCVKWIQKIEF